MFFNNSNEKKEQDLKKEKETLDKVKYDFLMYSKNFDIISLYKNIKVTHFSKNVYHIEDSESIYNTKINKNNENICIILMNNEKGENILDLNKEYEEGQNIFTLKDEKGIILFKFNFVEIVHWDKGIYYIYDSKDKEKSKKIAIINKGSRTNAIIETIK